jgi:hypothetical protein
MIGVTEYGCLDAPDDPLSCAIPAAEYKQATKISKRDKIISAPSSFEKLKIQNSEY